MVLLLKDGRKSNQTVEPLWRSPARYLWAMLLARIYDTTPLVCPVCSADMRIIAFARPFPGTRPYPWGLARKSASGGFL